MTKTVEKIIFKVAGVTNYKKAVKEACNQIGEDNGIPEYSKYYGNLSTKEIREELEEYSLKIFKYQDLDFFNIELIPEPNNKYDSNAIKVLIFGNHVGYVPAKIAKSIRKYFDDNKYNFVLEGEIKGGPYKEWDDFEEKVITNNDLDIGFEIYLSILDSTQVPETSSQMLNKTVSGKDSDSFTSLAEELESSKIVKKESPKKSAIALSVLGLLFFVSSISLLFQGEFGSFLVGIIITYFLIRPMINYFKK